MITCVSAIAQTLMNMQAGAIPRAPKPGVDAWNVDWMDAKPEAQRGCVECTAILPYVYVVKYVIFEQYV